MKVFDKLKNKRIMISVILIVLAIGFFGASLYLEFYLKESGKCGSRHAGANYHRDFCDKSCVSADDCKFVCGCEAINKNEDCYKEGIEISCEEPSKIECINEKCVALSEKDVCQQEGGEWRVFRNGCVDSCQYNRNKGDVMCTQALTYGCDCGEGKCWNSEEKVCENIDND